MQLSLVAGGFFFLNEGTEAKSGMEIFSIYKNKEDITDQSGS